MSELIRSYPTPLFDRLSCAGEEDIDGRQLLTPAQLDASIGRELLCLMNTRSKLNSAEFLVSTGGCLDYGVPDNSFLSPDSSADIDFLQSILKQAINHYEPRLDNVTVRVLTISRPSTKVILVINGTVIIDLMYRQLNFELQIDSQQGNRSKAIQNG